MDARLPSIPGHDAARARRGRARTILALSVIGLIAAGTFAQTLTYPFVYDDRHVIERNPVVTSPGGWANVFTSPYWPPQASIDPLYRPITTLSLKINYAVGGDSAIGFRVVNLLLHVGLTVLVAVFARRLWNRASAAWVAGALFAVHPIHVDALGLVVGRAELLAALFVTWMLWRHLRRDATRSGTSPRYHVMTSVLFLLALGSKEHAVIAWPAIMLIDLWRRQQSRAGEPWRPALRRVLASHHLGLMVALAAFLFMRWGVFGNRTTLPDDLVNRFANPLIDASVTVKLATPFALLWLVARQWFVAAPLCPIWSVGGLDLPSTFLRPDVLAGVAVAMAMLAMMVAAWRRRRHGWLPIGLLGLAVVLPCHFIPAANWLYAERWMVLPSVFLAVLCAGLATWAPRFSVVASTIAAVLLLTTTVPYSRCWQSHEELFEAVVERQPHSYHGLLGLAAVRHRAGRLRDSAAHVERLTNRFPNSARAWYYRVVLSAELEDWDAASEALEHWGLLRPPGPPPPEITRITEQIRAHGR